MFIQRICGKTADLLQAGQHFPHDFQYGLRIFFDRRNLKPCTGFVIFPHSETSRHLRLLIRKHLRLLQILVLQRQGINPLKRQVYRLIDGKQQLLIRLIGFCSPPCRLMQLCLFDFPHGVLCGKIYQISFCLFICFLSHIKVKQRLCGVPPYGLISALQCTGIQRQKICIVFLRIRNLLYDPLHIKNQCRLPDQLLTVGILLQFSPGPLKHLVIRTFLQHGVQLIDHCPDLLFRQFFMKRQQGIQRNIQKSCNRSQQCDIRKGIAVFPLIHRRGCHSKPPCHLFLRHIFILSVCSDHFSQLHIRFLLLSFIHWPLLLSAYQSSVHDTTEPLSCIFQKN